MPGIAIMGISNIPLLQQLGRGHGHRSQFVREAQRRGLSPYWECGTWNITSIRVAEKVGFERIAEERYWIGMFEG